ncbi:MAG: hypothetical protein ACUVQM_02575, partial [Candidatus Hadarchaeaceae archaeon]
FSYLIYKKICQTLNRNRTKIINGEMKMQRNNPRTPPLDERLNFLQAKISELERRIVALERSLPLPSLPVQKPSPPAPDSNQQKTDFGHKYLSRTISLAKRDYDRKNK